MAPDPVVIARNSSFAYRGRSTDVKQIGRELGVAYLIEGSGRTELRLRVKELEAMMRQMGTPTLAAITPAHVQARGRE